VLGEPNQEDLQVNKQSKERSNRENKEKRSRNGSTEIGSNPQRGKEEHRREGEEVGAELR